MTLAVSDAVRRAAESRVLRAHVREIGARPLDQLCPRVGVGK
jgi:hypothetical protein